MKRHETSAEAIERSALSDPDAQPLTDADFRRMERTPQAKIIRRALNLTQEEFALRCRIPAGTLRIGNREEANLIDPLALI